MFLHLNIISTSIDTSILDFFFLWTSGWRFFFFLGGGGGFLIHDHTARSFSFFCHQLHAAEQPVNIYPAVILLCLYDSRRLVITIMTGNQLFSLFLWLFNLQLTNNVLYLLNYFCVQYDIARVVHV